MIDRISGVAAHGIGLRQTERIPAGATFEFKLNLKVLSSDDASLLETVKIGLKMLTLDSLGGSGSRGYGKIRFNGLQLNGQHFVLPEQAFA
jgi:CRISPR-associated protein Csm3